MPKATSENITSRFASHRRDIVADSVEALLAYLDKHEAAKGGRA